MYYEGHRKEKKKKFGSPFSLSRPRPVTGVVCRGSRQPSSTLTGCHSGSWRTSSTSSSNPLSTALHISLFRLHPADMDLEVLMHPALSLPILPVFAL
ncbi:hypothetical protein CesoFtcFv8_017753 [Champsocephalus esox]|uniref:Uncharacterized protein n=1 Tax=Champsocephalus esox TaxID=159716 RepID=A0AAN8GS43_9TELE|nr:hypothetical protein CesoFtcFv8_017753 [Champsocephalus esox]